MNDTRDTAVLKVNVKRLMAYGSAAFLLTILVLGVLGWRAGIFASVDALRAFLGRMGIWAPAALLLVQIIQIIIPVIPGGITCAAGVLAFGPVYGFLCNYVGIVLGSYIAFALARRLGLPLIRSIASEKALARYAGWLEKEQALFDKLFALAIFLPFMPDDVLCMLAGVSGMKTRTFWFILLLCKIPFLLPYSLGLPVIARWLGA